MSEDNNRYIGVEQEFVSFNKNDLDTPIDAKPHFTKIRDKEGEFFEIGRRAIRTTTGHAIYTDGEELEVCTPPVRINTGFASRLTDLVMIGREKIAESVPDLTHTGLSMHWNLSRDYPDNNFYSGIVLPFHLMGINPLSSALNMRFKKENGTPGRAEFLGDFITNEDQINALALLMGAYSYAFDNNKGDPKLRLSNFKPGVGSRTNIFLPDGRFSTAITDIPSLNFDGPMQAQHYLELFYQWIKPFSDRLGNRREINNLEDFIFARKKLEFDQFKYFAHVSIEKRKKNGTYYPLTVSDNSVPDKVLRLSGKERTLPLEGKLFGEFAKRHREFSALDWGQVYHRDKKIQGIESMYQYSHSLNSDNLVPVPSIPLSEFTQVPALVMTEQQGPKQYDSSSDTFIEDRHQFAKTAAKSLVSSMFSLKGLVTGVVGVGLGLGVGYISSSINHAHKVNKQVDSIVTSYSQNVSTNNIAYSPTNINLAVVAGVNQNGR